MKNLIGKIIEKIFIDEGGQNYLSFQTNEGVINYYGEGDCCSETYFSDVNRLRNLFGQKVIQVEEIALMEEEIPKRQSRQKEDIIYGIRLWTELGESLIIYRNSSNGYYGGSVEEVDEIPPEIKMVEIIGDYTAPL